MSRRQEQTAAGILDRRGNSLDRKRRKLWMLSNEKFGGDGTSVGCVHCGERVYYDTVEADRIVPGGSYRRDNVQPSCRACNNQRGDDPAWTYQKETA